MLLFLQFAGGFLSYLYVYNNFPISKNEVFPQQAHSIHYGGNTPAIPFFPEQAAYYPSAISMLFKKLPPLSEWRSADIRHAIFSDRMVVVLRAIIID